MRTALACARRLLPDRGHPGKEVADEGDERRRGHEEVVVGESSARKRDAEAPGGRKPEERELSRERGVVGPAAAGERRARPEEDCVENAAAVAEHPVRDELREVEGPAAGE